MRLITLIRRHLTSFRVILLGFAALILTGAVLLMLPVSIADGMPVSFADALFTSTSAVCVTGLVVFDTASKWTLFGRIVILLLIQIGGLGVVTMSVLLMIATGKRIGIFQRMAMQDAVSAPQIGGIIRFTRFFLRGTVIIEAAGALLLFPFFAKDFGFLRGAGFAIFHSISAFCNAGFDLMGVRTSFSSFTYYADHTGIMLVLSALIIIGGLGYLSWEDLLHHRFRLKHLRMQTKIILTMTAILITVPFLYFFLLEFSHLPLKERALVSFFQSVTPRTAGFNTFPYAHMSEAGLLITIVLMLTGGAPGSAAGGMKVTTLYVLLLSAHASLQRRDEVSGFHRRIEIPAIRNAFTLLTVYLTLLITGTILISVIERLPVLPVMFECASALGTVGLTVGITPTLTIFSRVILTGFMFMGRCGGITIAYAMIRNPGVVHNRLPAEKLTVG